MKVIIRLMKGGPLLDDVPVAKGDTMADLWRKIREEKTLDSAAKLLHGRGDARKVVDADDTRTLEEVRHTSKYKNGFFSNVNENAVVKFPNCRSSGRRRRSCCF